MIESSVKALEKKILRLHSSPQASPSRFEWSILHVFCDGDLKRCFIFQHHQPIELSADVFHGAGDEHAATGFFCAGVIQYP